MRDCATSSGGYAAATPAVRTRAAIARIFFIFVSFFLSSLFLPVQSPCRADARPLLRRQCVLAVDLVGHGAVGVRRALVGSPAPDALVFSGAARERPGAAATRELAVLHGRRAVEVSRRLVAVRQGRRVVAVAGRFVAVHLV